MPVLLSSWNPAPQDAGFHEDNEKSVRITEIFPKTYLRMNNIYLERFYGKPMLYFIEIQKYNIPG